MVQPLSAITDSTELRLRSEMMLRMAGNLARFGGWSLNVATQTTFWSNELCRILGFPEGKPPHLDEAYALYPEADRLRVAGLIRTCSQEGTAFDLVGHIRDAGGSLLTVRVVGEALLDSTGRITHVEGAFHDITQQENERESIRRDVAIQSQVISSQAALLDVARDAISVRDLDNVIQYWNRAAEVLYGWRATEVVGLSVRDLLYDDPTQFDLATAAVVRDGQWTGDIRQRSRTGDSILAECSWTLVRDDDGRPTSIFVVNSDVTDRRRVDDLTLRRQRMESLGTLAGGVAHDLNNVLAPILLGVQTLSRTELDPNRMSLLRIIEASVKRGADMIRQVLSFAQGAEGIRVRVDVLELVAELEAFAGEALPKNVSVATTMPETLWPIIGDSTQLLQVLVNLVTNARDAMHGGGTIKISARNAEVRDAFASVSHLASPGRYVAIDVEDDGEGMSAEVMDKAFEPFFTTKDPGHGTGLGLASSLAIIRGHGGYIQLYSEPGHGSRFQLYLPVEPDLAEGQLVPGDVPVAELPSGRGQTVLVVDDEEAIRQLTCQILESYNYRTLSASNGAEALAILHDGPDHIDLVLTDMMMPVMDGAVLAGALAESFPALPVIAASGLNANGGVARAASSGVRNFLSKPFTTQTLVQAVGDVLNGKDAPDV